MPAETTIHRMPPTKNRVRDTTRDMKKLEPDKLESDLASPATTAPIVIDRAPRKSNKRSFPAFFAIFST